MIVASPNSVVSASDASRKSEVGIPSPLLASAGTSTKDFLRFSKNVLPPEGA